MLQKTAKKTGKSKGRNTGFLLIVTLCCCLMAFFLLFDSSVITDGVKAGLLICANVIIPSLFPFMVLTTFITHTNVSEQISKPFASFTRRLFHLDEHLGYVVIMSCIGGYPVGAKIMSILYEQGKLSKETIQRMLWFCCNAGPSFIISAVGAGMYNNLRVGLLFYLSQLLSSLVMGIMISRNSAVIPLSPSAKNTTTDIPSAFVDSVCGGTTSILTMCGFVTLFAAINRLFTHLGVYDWLCAVLHTVFPWVDAAVFSSIFTGFLEVTSGCIASSQLSGVTSWVVTGFLISFCSISVIFQVMAMLRNVSIHFGQFFLSRLCNGLLTSLISTLLLKIMPGVTAVSTDPVPFPVSNVNTPLLVICLLGMCCLLFVSVKNKGHKGRQE